MTAAAAVLYSVGRRGGIHSLLVSAGCTNLLHVVWRMVPTTIPDAVVRFGVFEFDLKSGELHKHGRRVRLSGQPAQILALLMRRPGELVTRDELQQALWPANTHVNFEQSINAAVKRLRYALGDSPERPVFIETLARRGYRFIAPASAPGQSHPSAARPGHAVNSIAVLPFENATADDRRTHRGSHQRGFAAAGSSGAGPEHCLPPQRQAGGLPGARTEAERGRYSSG